jgi:HAMP domain-containing protein
MSPSAEMTISCPSLPRRSARVELYLWRNVANPLSPVSGIFRELRLGQFHQSADNVTPANRELHHVAASEVRVEEQVDGFDVCVARWYERHLS